LGQVDYHLYNPWHPLERILYPKRINARPNTKL
jgi:hypothetical protein